MTTEPDESYPWRAGWTAWLVTTVAWALLGSAALLLAWTLLPAAAGWASDVVVSGSMQPTLAVGDVVVSRPVAASHLHVGNVLVVLDPDHPGAHRVHRLVSRDQAGLHLRGDANAVPDSSPVPPDDVVGVATLRVPLIGWLLVWARDGAFVPLGLTVSALGCLLALGRVHRPEEQVATAPSRGRRRSVAAAAVAVALAAGQSPAQGVFTARTSSTAPWAAATWWSCDAAARGEGAARYYAMQESSSFLFPQTALDRGTLGAAAQGQFSLGQPLGQPGPACGAGDTRAAAFNTEGLALVLPTQVLTTPGPVAAPVTTTVQVWVRTTRDGTLASFTDRFLLYVDTAGRLALGVDDGSRHALVGSRVDDGTWHLATATVGPGGVRLYVDGTLVASDATVSTLRSGSGWWRFGDGATLGWPAGPVDGHLSGWLAHAAVFPTSLTATQVAQQAAAVV